MSHKTAECREPECRAAIIYLPTPTGGNMPCDAVSVAADDRLYDKSRHVSHFKTCKNPRRFSGSNRKRKP